jgi:Family of unknown function (DUF6256)
VVLYYYGVAKVGGSFLDSEFSGSALLLAISLPVFFLASWLTQRWLTQRKRDRPGR